MKKVTFFFVLVLSMTSIASAQSVSICASTNDCILPGQAVLLTANYSGFPNTVEFRWQFYNDSNNWETIPGTNQQTITIQSGNIPEDHNGRLFRVQVRTISPNGQWYSSAPHSVDKCCVLAQTNLLLTGSVMNDGSALLQIYAESVFRVYIQYSSDGSNFRDIAQVVTASYRDQTFNGNGYYRIRAVLITEENRYSAILHLQKTGDTPEVKLFPNPTRNFVVVEGIPEPMQLAVYDMQGKIVYRNIVLGSPAQVSLSTLQAGTYTFVFYNEKRSLPAQKVIKQ